MRPWLIPLLALAALLAGCPGTDDTPAAGVEDWLSLKVGEVAFEAQVAIKEGEQRKGLMHRDALPENGGMLFPSQQPRRMSFWMANTRIPLDIGFFDSTGTLLEVHRMIPHDTTRTVSRSEEVRYALEMNSGWFAQNGVLPGAQLDLELLARALQQRGADPRTFGLNRP